MTPALRAPASPAPDYTAPAFFLRFSGTPPPPAPPPSLEARGKSNGSSTSVGSSSPTPTIGSGDEGGGVAEEVAAAALSEDATVASREPLKIDFGSSATGGASEEGSGLQRAVDLELPVKLLKGASGSPTAHAGAAGSPSSPHGVGDDLTPMKMLRLEAAIGSSTADQEPSTIATLPGRSISLPDAWTPLMQQWGAWSGPVGQGAADAMFSEFSEQAFADYSQPLGMEIPLMPGMEAFADYASQSLGMEIPQMPGMEAFVDASMPPGLDACPEASQPPGLELELPLASGTQMEIPTPIPPGSALHAVRQCKPCAWFWKPGGCQNDFDCSYCHLCPEGELKARKKAKAVMSRLGGNTPKTPGESDRGAAGNVLRLSFLI